MVTHAHEGDGGGEGVLMTTHTVVIGRRRCFPDLHFFRRYTVAYASPGGTDQPLFPQEEPCCQWPIASVSTAERDRGREREGGGK